MVSDLPKILPAEAHAEADTRIREIQGLGLGDIGVAILPAIGDYAPSEVGVAIYRTWKIGSVAEIGSAHRNVGVLLLIVPKELAPDGKGQCWITTGTGAEGIVTDAASGAICRDQIIPRLKEKDYGGAVLAGIDGIEARLRNDAALAAGDSGALGLVGSGAGTDDDGDASTSPLIYVLGGILGIGGLGAGGVGVARMRRNRPRPCPTCGHVMARLDETGDDQALSAGQKIEEHLKSIDYDVWRCTCGGELIIPYRKIFTKYSACRECRNRTAWSRSRTVMPATTHSSGLRELSWRCEACPATWTTTEVTPRISESSSSSSSGGSSGGSSFGGSGSTSGGGGGSSY